MNSTVSDTLSSEDFAAWIGKRESSCDVLTLAPMVGMAATLDRPDRSFNNGDPLPPLWHWLYFLDPAPQSGLGSDGHAARGGFLPPIPLPRRMWAGSRLEFHAPLRLGEAIRRESHIASIDCKQGRSGQLAFVCVEHRFFDDDGLCLSEAHDIVYRDPAPVGSAAAGATQAPPQHDFARSIEPDPVLLFRYSALTFNGHRIHYDRNYVTEVEGYPGLIVHGPLLATYLVELLQEACPGRELLRYRFKALQPVFDLEPFEVCGLLPTSDNEVELWVQDQRGTLCMQAFAELA